VLETFKTNVLEGYYQQHSQGSQLLNIDIQALSIYCKDVKRENEVLKEELNKLEENKND